VTTFVKTSLICALAHNRVIGRDNQLLWRLKSDLRRFRDLTTGKPVIMGRKTHESIGRPLPNRDNIVVTRDSLFAGDGILVAHSLDEAFSMAAECAKRRGSDEIMVAGGGEIYAQTIGKADMLYLTEVDLEPPGDALFPAVERQVWKETSRKSHAKGPDDEASFSFVDYARR
jgi:dihydrofolate reductase